MARKPFARTIRPAGKTTALRVIGGVLAVWVVLFVVIVASSGISVGERVMAYVDIMRGNASSALKLGLVYADSEEVNSFTNGARLAAARVNAEDGILDQDLELLLFREEVTYGDGGFEATVARTMRLAGEVARQNGLFGVIGHEWSDTAVTASAIYNRNDILYLATHATASSLTNHGFSLLFALQPDNSDNTEMVARYALSTGLKRFLVLTDKSDYGKEAGDFFSAVATSQGGDVVFRGYLPGHRGSMDQLIMFILENDVFGRGDYDAFFVASAMSLDTARFIRRARELGLDQPVLGLEYMFSNTVEAHVGKENMKDVIGVSLFDSESVTDLSTAFIKEYRSKYNAMPDLSAALGYDAVMLLKEVVERTGTLDPGRIADALKVARYGVPFEGVTGKIVFDTSGLITDTDVFVVRHDGTRFETVASYRKPLEWSAEHIRTGGDDSALMPDPAANKEHTVP
ncbi:ABC transporter substrate-binding protein [Stappia indica]|uniref:ABC transporter substrate-binding protein n=1 Tax=Stappia indica TaxID=538381 RepID=UPI0009F58A65|nr:ABC transporter substrate-binding protein [Stappia indica]